MIKDAKTIESINLEIKNYLPNSFLPLQHKSNLSNLNKGEAVNYNFTLLLTITMILLKDLKQKIN